MNVDSLRTYEAIHNTIDNIKSNKIDIACIQETHNERCDNIIIGDYEIYFGGCIESKINRKTTQKGGVAIITHKSISPHIQSIYRINGRIMEIRTHTGKINKIFLY